MNRFDDRMSWQIFRMILMPILSAILTGGIIYGSIRERVVAVETKVQQNNSGVRLTVLETNFSTMKEDMTEMKHDVKEILKRVR